MKRRKRVVAAVLIAVAGLGAGVGGTAAQQLPPPPPLGSLLRIVPTPGVPAVPTIVPGETGEQRMQRLLRDRPGSRIVDIAAETRGRVVTIAGKAVQLPPDAYVEAVVTHVLCGAGNPCAETPAYNIRRGQSLIGVGLQTGRINAERTVPGEAGAFDFLKRALQ